MGWVHDVFTPGTRLADLFVVIGVWVLFGFVWQTRIDRIAALYAIAAALRDVAAAIREHGRAMGEGGDDAF